jgi:hypothetical protein
MTTGVCFGNASLFCSKIRDGRWIFGLSRVSKVFSTIEISSIVENAATSAVTWRAIHASDRFEPSNFAKQREQFFEKQQTGRH